MKRACAIMLLLLVFMAGVIAFWFSSSIPTYNGTIKTDAVLAKTRIYRDAQGIPHIFADSANDAYAALGYVHASERLFQMEMMRRAGSGRLSQVLGKDLIHYDKKMRMLGFARDVDGIFKGLSPEAQSAMQAYAAGVNAFLDGGILSSEFGMLGFKPARWMPSDGLLWAKLMAWQLSNNWEDEAFRESLLKNGWTKEQVNLLYPVQDKNVPSVMKPMEWVARPEAQGIRPETTAAPSFPKTSHLGPRASFPHTASNAYVIAGMHTQSGKPILANDPHLQLQAPALWFLARIVTPDWEIKGATAPGMPFFPLAQTRDVAWGFTTSNMDVQDLIFINADAKVTIREEVIHVKDEADVVFKVEENAHGPVASGIMADVAAITPPDKKAVLQFTGLNKKDRTAEALYRMNHAKDAGAIQTAIRDYSAPPQNLVYADSKGQVGYAAVGDVPVRMGDGFYAKDNRPWKGMMARSALPALKNPKAGVIMTANNAVMDDKQCKGFTCAFSRDWSEPYRAMRLESWFKERFADHKKFDVSGASEAMLDITSVAAKRILPFMLKSVADDNDVAKALRSWDGSMKRNAPEPLIFHAWLDSVMTKTFGDAYQSEVLWPRMSALENVFKITEEKKNAAKRICFFEGKQDGVQDVVQYGLNDAIEGLRKKYGDDWKKWRWGDAHKAPLTHPLWSHVPVVGDLTSLKTETDGDGYTLRRAAPATFQKPFDDEHGAGYRGVYDLAQPDNSKFIIATGQAGHLFSKHYGDMRERWSNGEFITLSGDEKTFQQSGAAILVLGR